jgi:hypothetical protein
MLKKILKSSPHFPKLKVWSTPAIIIRCSVYTKRYLLDIIKDVERVEAIYAIRQARAYLCNNTYQFPHFDGKNII